MKMLGSTNVITGFDNQYSISLVILNKHMHLKRETFRELFYKDQELKKCAVYINM